MLIPNYEEIVAAEVKALEQANLENAYGTQGAEFAAQILDLVADMLYKIFDNAMIENNEEEDYNERKS